MDSQLVGDGGNDVRSDGVPVGLSMQLDPALPLVTGDEEQLGGKEIRSDVVPVGFSMQPDLALQLGSRDTDKLQRMSERNS